jgi:hypothetical protein
LAASLGLLLWLAVGTAIVKWYDRKRLYRLHPDILTYVSASVQDYKIQHTTAVPTLGTQPEQTDQGHFPRS